MTISRELFFAILSMDSYNRGYEAGLSDSPSDSDVLGSAGSKLGYATLKGISLPSGSVAAGFFATAYDLPAGAYGSPTPETVISYRGTDVYGSSPIDLLPFFKVDAGSDIWNGWSAGLAIVGADQSALAIEYYQQVVDNRAVVGETYFDANVALTGHSLGGGLGGLIGALYSRRGILFDNMPFESAASGTYIVATAGGVYDGDVKRLVYGNTGHSVLYDYSGITSISTDGEILSAARLLQETEDKQWDLGDGVELSNFYLLENVARHSMATLVIRMFAEISYNDAAGLADWRASAKYFWPIMYDHTYAGLVGMSSISGVLSGGAKYADVLRMTIAYSALDSDAQDSLPFGNSAIRAFYDDANNLGLAIGINLERYGALISKIFIDYAGKLALHKVVRSAGHKSLDGVLTYSSASDDATLAVSFDDTVWKQTNADSKSTVVPSIVARKELVDTILNGVGFGGANAGVAPLIRSRMQSLWGNSTETAINHIAFAVPTTGTYVMTPSATPNNAAMFVGNDASDAITGTAGNDLIYGGQGDDRLIGGAGKDILLGGAGFDTADYGLDPTRVIVTTGPDGGYTIKDGYGGEDWLYSIENLVLTKHDDVINRDTTSVGLTRYVDGGAGKDTLYTDVFGSLLNVAYDALGLQRTQVTNVESIRSDRYLVDATKSYDINQSVNDSTFNRPSTIYWSLPAYGIVPAFYAYAPIGTGRHYDWSTSTSGGNFRIGFGAESDFITLGGARKKAGSFSGSELHGTNHGDYVDLGYGAFRSTVLEFGDYTPSSIGLTPFVFHTGTGDDTVKTVWSRAGDGGHWEADGWGYSWVSTYAFPALTLTYSGGNDTYFVYEGLREIRLENGILVSDVSISQSGSPSAGSIINVLSIKNYGTLRLITEGPQRVAIRDDAGGAIHLGVEVFAYPYPAGSPYGNPTYIISPGKGHIDTVNGSWGNDVWADRAANDITYYGLGGNDRIDDGDGSNKLYGGVGNDTLTAGDGNNSLYGGPDDDVIIAGGGANLIDGGEGHDTVSYDHMGSGIGIDRTAGRITHGGKIDTIVGIESVVGTKFNDTDTGGIGNDTYVVSAGNDEIIDPGGTDTALLTSGYSLENVTLAKAGTADLSIILAAGIDYTTIAGQFGEDSAKVIENLTFADGFTLDLASYGSWQFVTADFDGDNADTPSVDISDTIIGGPAGQMLSGYDASDTIFAGAGFDTIAGGTGNDLLHGGSGNDTLTGDTGADGLWGGAGDDVFVFQSGDSPIATPDTISEGAGEGVDTIKLTGGILPASVRMWTDQAGSITLRYTATDQLVIRGGLDAAAQTTTGMLVEKIVFDEGVIWALDQGLSMVDVDDAHTLIGSAKNDELYGRGGDDRLVGNHGDDLLTGGLGADSIAGGKGDDTYAFSIGDSLSTSPDTLVEFAGEGTDTIKLTGGILPAHVQVWATTTGVLNIQYSENDLITLPNVYLSAPSEVRSIAWEKLAFDNGVISDLSYVPVLGTDGNDSVEGSGSADDLRGQGGDDSISGYGGNDTLDGGMGNDSVSGGDGDDTYLFKPGDSSGVYPENVYEYTDEGTDSIKLTGGILPSAVRLWTEANVLSIQYTASDLIKVQGSYNPDSSFRADVEIIAFDDGTEWNLADGLYLNDTDDAHQIQGSSKDDNIDGQGGDDNIETYGGDDLLTGGVGSDNLFGGSGNDTYVFNPGDSSGAYPENVYEYTDEGTDTIKLTGGILPSTVRLWTESNILNIRYTATDLIKIQGSYNPDSAFRGELENIVFDDGTIWNLAHSLNINDTDDAHQIQGSSKDDGIDGQGGDDNVQAYGGDDVITGGAGSDYLSGGEGNDTYVFKLGDSSGAWSDSVYEYADEGIDVIRLTGGILPSSVELATSGSNLLIKYSPTDTIIVPRIHDSEENTYTEGIERIVFDNGATWDFTTGIVASGSPAGETITGDDFIDIMNGNGGADTLYGRGARDILNGGAGDDRLEGGSESDHYIYEAGHGRDVIYDIDGAADTIELGGGYTAANIILARVGQFDLAIKSGATELILIEGQFANGSSVETIKFSDGTILDLLTHSHTVNGTPSDDTIDGTSYGAGPDILNGLGGNDTIYAGVGNDTVSGGSGDDAISGDDGDDELEGNAGDDTINGGEGNDTIFYDTGADALYDYGGMDVISITTLGVTAAGMALVRPSGSRYDLEVWLHGTHAFDLRNQFNANSGFETIMFADGASFDLTKVQYTTNGTELDDQLFGINSGGNPDDILNGYAGNDYLYGYAGDDKFTGGAGDDAMYGEDGDDTYFYNLGDGVDTILDAKGNDTLQLGAGYAKSDLTWDRIDNDDMSLHLKGIEVVRIAHHFQGGSIETVKFADGTTLALTGLDLTQTGSDDADSLSGFDITDDVLSGLDGDDVLMGYDGNDTLIGGAGREDLYGGSGNDTYVFNRGDSTTVTPDHVWEEADEGTDTIKLTGGILPSDVLMWVDGSYLHIYPAAGDEILVRTATNPDGASAIGAYVEKIVFDDESVIDLTGAIVMTDTNDAHDMIGSDFGDTLHAEGGDDSITSYGGDDIITGGAGDDRMSGGHGDDSLDGGEGNDTAVIDAAQGDARIARIGTQMLVVSPDGRDTLVNIEHVSFSDTGNLDTASLTPTDELIAITRSTTVDWHIPDRYSGPVVGLAYELLGSEQGEIVGATSMGDFINGLGGDDAISGGGGNDVLDGGVGSSFLTGGDGIDVFFADGRGASLGAEITWSTITDWTIGETLTLWGWLPGLSTYEFEPSDGTPGFTGATLHADLDGNGAIDTSVTWAGKVISALPTPVEANGYLWIH